MTKINREALELQKLGAQNGVALTPTGVMASYYHRGSNVFYGMIADHLQNIAPIVMSYCVREIHSGKNKNEEHHQTWAIFDVWFTPPRCLRPHYYKIYLGMIGHTNGKLGLFLDPTLALASRKYCFNPSEVLVGVDKDYANRVAQQTKITTEVLAIKKRMVDRVNSLLDKHFKVQPVRNRLKEIKKLLRHAKGSDKLALEQEKQEAEETIYLHYDQGVLNRTVAFRTKTISAIGNCRPRGNAFRALLLRRKLIELYKDFMTTNYPKGQPVIPVGKRQPCPGSKRKARDIQNTPNKKRKTE